VLNAFNGMPAKNSTEKRNDDEKRIDSVLLAIEKDFDPDKNIIEEYEKIIVQRETQNGKVHFVLCPGLPMKLCGSKTRIQFNLESIFNDEKTINQIDRRDHQKAVCYRG